MSLIFPIHGTPGPCPKKGFDNPGDARKYIVYIYYPTDIATQKP